jgi:hypothetical protein
MKSEPNRNTAAIVYATSYGRQKPLMPLQAADLTLGRGTSSRYCEARGPRDSHEHITLGDILPKFKARPLWVLGKGKTGVDHQGERR